MLLALSLGLLVMVGTIEGQGQQNNINKPYVCYATDPDPYLQFGTRTAYDFSSRRQEGRNQEQSKIPGCRPLQVWMVARHGSKNPSATDIERFSTVNNLRDEIVRNSQEAKTSKLCAQDLQNLQNWNPSFTAEDEDKLSQQGREDMTLLARRIKTRFPEVMNREYSEQNFVFRHTAAERTKTSAETFVQTLFPGTEVRMPPPGESDPVLRSYEKCQHWKEMVDDHPDTLKQMELFLANQDMQALASNVSVRLGFKYNLALDGLLYAYDLCRYEKANNIKAVSAWCAIFSSTELKLIEYAEDLKYFYNSGYGNALNQKVGCPLLNDFMYRFRRIAAGAAEPGGVFYFTHLNSIMTLLTRMGISTDANWISSTNYQWQQKRQWKTSAISPFGANLMAVFLNCTLPRGGSELKVAFYLQETIVPLKGCEVGLCSWNFIMDQYMGLAEDCNLNRTCSGAEGVTRLHHVNFSFLVTFTSIFALSSSYYFKLN